MTTHVEEPHDPSPHLLPLDMARLARQVLGFEDYVWAMDTHLIANVSSVTPSPIAPKSCAYTVVFVSKIDLNDDGETYFNVPKYSV
jgi:hypothetical protein